MNASIFDSLERGWDHSTHQSATQATATQPAQPTQPEEHVSLTQDLGKVKDAIHSAAGWRDIADSTLQDVLDRLAALEANPVVAALQAAVLTPQLEEAIAGLITGAAAAMPGPVTVVQPAPADEQPAS